MSLSTPASGCVNQLRHRPHILSTHQYRHRPRYARRDGQDVHRYDHDVEDVDSGLREAGLEGLVQVLVSVGHLGLLVYGLE